MRARVNGVRVRMGMTKTSPKYTTLCTCRKHGENDILVCVCDIRAAVFVIRSVGHYWLFAQPQIPSNVRLVVQCSLFTFQPKSINFRWDNNIVSGKKIIIVSLLTQNYIYFMKHKTRFFCLFFFFVSLLGCGRQICKPQNAKYGMNNEFLSRNRIGSFK